MAVLRVHVQPRRNMCLLYTSYLGLIAQTSYRCPIHPKHREARP
jgi:hypothetical protein